MAMLTAGRLRSQSRQPHWVTRVNRLAITGSIILGERLPTELTIETPLCPGHAGLHPPSSTSANLKRRCPCGSRATPRIPRIPADGEIISRCRGAISTGLLLAKPNAAFSNATLSKGPKLPRRRVPSHPRRGFLLSATPGVTGAIDAGGLVSQNFRGLRPSSRSCPRGRQLPSASPTTLHRRPRREGAFPSTGPRLSNTSSATIPPQRRRRGCCSSRPPISKTSANPGPTCPRYGGGARRRGAIPLREFDGPGVCTRPNTRRLAPP